MLVGGKRHVQKQTKGIFRMQHGEATISTRTIGKMGLEICWVEKQTNVKFSWEDHWAGHLRQSGATDLSPRQPLTRWCD